MSEAEKLLDMDYEVYAHTGEDHGKLKKRL